MLDLRLILICLLLASPLGCQSRERVVLSRWVTIHPGSSIIQLPGKSASLPVVVRNVSPQKLSSLRLKVNADCCKSEVNPKTIPAISPGDRRVFAVTLQRKEDQPEKRSAMYLTLYGKELPVPVGMDLMVDLSAAPGGAWMDVGQVKLMPRGDSRTVYYVLAGAPILILIGWLLWRWSRAPRWKNIDQ